MEVTALTKSGGESLRSGLLFDYLFSVPTLLFLYQIPRILSFQYLMYVAQNSFLLYPVYPQISVAFTYYFLVDQWHLQILGYS